MKIKVNLKIALVIMFTCVLFLNRTHVKATELPTDGLLVFKDYVISKTTTIEQINSNFGQPKLVTESAFGGNAYSYYDEDYTWYLHIETNVIGEIKGFGCINGDFISKNYSYGATYNGVTSFLKGTVVVNDIYDKEITGFYGYNCTSDEVDSYWNTYGSDSKYLYDLQKNSVIVSKLLAKKHNYSFPQTYISEELFYTNEQLKANGSDLYKYSSDNGKSKYISLVMSQVEYFNEDLPNPIRMGKKTEYYTQADNYKYIFYDINYGGKNSASSTIIFIDPNFTEEKNSVELTANELNLFEAVKEQYALYNEHGKAIKNNFDETPVYKSLPLVAGKWSDNALYMVTDYLNIARAGLGIGTLTLNMDIADCAQHKATLVYYLNNVEKKNVSHVFDKPDCVDDEFYTKSMSYMNENLYSGNIQMSIINALNDGYGDAVECGHRYNLLEPSYTQWGVGAVGSGVSFGWQGCHKFSGYKSYENELVAWPSNGIFPIDMVNNGIGNWTAQFYKNYTVSENTEVTIKCLNNGKTYEITNQNKDDSTKFLKNTGSRLLTFRDDSVVYENGDVFEITLHNVTDSNGNNVDYTYRSVFMSLYQIGKTDVEDIVIDKEEVNLLVGETQKINATILPENATNKLIKFSSSNENVASVRQDGLIVAKSTGKVNITIESEDKSSIDSSKTVKVITVIVKQNANDPDFFKGDLNKDGMINANDAAVALDLYKYNNSTDEDILIGDMDGNGVINANDAALILDVYKYSR